jgi:DNA-binding NarL/FixJ family response regulator
MMSDTTDASINDTAPKWPGGLTAREIQVAERLATGYKSTEIAAEFAISVKTVDTHRGHLLNKAGLRDEVALTRFAIREGLVSGDKSADAPGCADRKKRAAA